MAKFIYLQRILCFKLCSKFGTWVVPTVNSVFMFHLRNQNIMIAWRWQHWLESHDLADILKPWWQLTLGYKMSNCVESYERVGCHTFTMSLPCLIKIIDASELDFRNFNDGLLKAISESSNQNLSQSLMYTLLKGKNTQNVPTVNVPSVKFSHWRNDNTMSLPWSLCPYRGHSVVMATVGTILKCPYFGQYSLSCFATSHSSFRGYKGRIATSNW